MPDLIYRTVSDRNDVILDLAADLKNNGYVVIDGRSQLIVEWKWEFDGRAFSTLSAGADLAARNGRSLEWEQKFRKFAELCLSVCAVEH